MAETERWAFPVTEWERATIAEILKLPTVRVTRVDAGFLSGLGMLSKQCHQNASVFSARMAQQGARIITGWIKNARVLTLHSIVQLDGRYFCVTPTPAEREIEFDFIPDPAVEALKIPGGFSLQRNTVPLGIGLRRFSDQDQRWFAEAVARLKSGIDPSEAISFQLAAGSDRVTTRWPTTEQPDENRYNWRRRLG